MNNTSLLRAVGALFIVCFVGCSSSGDQVVTGPDTKASSELLAKGGGSTPTVTTAAPKQLTSRSATVGGTVNTGGSGIVQRGVCYATSATPTVASSTVVNGSGDGSFECVLMSLTASTLYYARAYSVDRKGTVKYGSQVTFTTLQSYGTVADADGNVYQTVTIGGQVWLMENLKTTKYRDGSAIDQIPGDQAWGSTTTGAYCSYNNDDGNVPTYGRLYNSHAVFDPRSIAPAGWRVATAADWNTLASYLGGESIAGGKLKSVGTTLWRDPNFGATNAVAFSAQPGGYRSVITTTTGDLAVEFAGLAVYAYFWTSTMSESGIGVRPESRYMSYPNAQLANSGQHGIALNHGYTVRLVKE